MFNTENKQNITKNTVSVKKPLSPSTKAFIEKVLSKLLRSIDHRFPIELDEAIGSCLEVSYKNEGNKLTFNTA